MRYICKNNWIYSEELLDILSKKFGIYMAKSIDNFMGCIWLKLWDKFCKTMGYTGPLDKLKKTKGCLRQNYGIYWIKLWDILLDIFVKSYGIYMTKRGGHIGKTMG